MLWQTEDPQTEDGAFFTNQTALAVVIPISFLYVPLTAPGFYRKNWKRSIRFYKEGQAVLHQNDAKDFLDPSR